MFALFMNVNWPKKQCKRLTRPFPDQEQYERMRQRTRKTQCRELRMRINDLLNNPQRWGKNGTVSIHVTTAEIATGALDVVIGELHEAGYATARSMEGTDEWLTVWPPTDRKETES